MRRNDAIKSVFRLGIKLVHKFCGCKERFTSAVAVNMDSNQKGNLANFKFLLRAHELEAIVCKPVIDSSRYDFIIDFQNKLYRVQLKYAGRDSTNADGSINLVLTKKIKGKYVSYQQTEIDVLMMYCPITDKFYWINPDMFHNKTSITLRFQPCKNNMQNRINFAKDFEW